MGGSVIPKLTEWTWSGLGGIFFARLLYALLPVFLSSGRRFTSVGCWQGKGSTHFRFVRAL